MERSGKVCSGVGLDLAKPFCHYAGVAPPVVTAARDDWERVGQAIRARRLHLDIGQDQLGISKAVASNLENGKQTSFARSSLMRVSRALGWTSDSIERMVRGEDPISAEPSVDERLAALEARFGVSPGKDSRSVEERLADLERRYAEGRSNAH